MPYKAYKHYKNHKTYHILEVDNYRIQEDGKWVKAYVYAESNNLDIKYVRSAKEFNQKFKEV